MKELNKPEINVDEPIDDHENFRTIRKLYQHITERDVGRVEKQKKRKRIYLHSIGRRSNLRKLQIENSKD